MALPITMRCINQRLKLSGGTLSGELTVNANVIATKFIGPATKLGIESVGTTTKPIYLDGGLAVSCDATVGSTTQPVCFNNGTITPCVSYTDAMVGNSVKWSGSTKTISTGAPSGGVDGDIWFQY